MIVDTREFATARIRLLALVDVLAFDVLVRVLGLVHDAKALVALAFALVGPEAVARGATCRIALVADERADRVLAELARFARRFEQTLVDVFRKLRKKKKQTVERLSCWASENRSGRLFLTFT